MKLRDSISAVTMMIITVTICVCNAALDADPAHLPQRYAPRVSDLRNDVAVPTTEPASFTMDDLTVLSHSKVAIEPIEDHAHDELVVEDDGRIAEHEATQEDQAPVDEREMFNVAGVVVSPRSPIPPLAAPSQGKTLQRVPRVKASTKSQRATPATLHDTSITLDREQPFRHQEQRPQVHHVRPLNIRPCPKPRATERTDDEELSIPSQPPCLRPAYRMHIRANGQGLEPLLHKLIAAMTTVADDKTTRPPPDSELETAPTPQDEEEQESEVRYHPRPQHTTPPFETLQDPEAPDGDEAYPYAVKKKTKIVETQPPEDVITSFRGRRDAFSVSLPPSPSPKPAHSKLIGV